jgi:ribosomal protein S12 methylthiotransferase accessory factor
VADTSTLSGRVTIAGTGALRTEIERRLTGVTAAPVVLAVSDGWDVPLLEWAAANAAADRLPFLGVHVELGRAVIGPLVRPGVPGCARCVATRRAALDVEAEARRTALLAHHGDRLAGPSGWLTAFAVGAVAGIVAAELSTLATGGLPRTLGAVIVVELDRLAVEVHPFLPDPRCATCAAPAMDRPASLRLASRPAPDPGELRATRLTGRADALRRTYLDGFAGLVGEVREVDAAGLPVSYARTGLPGIARREYGIGRATDRRTSGLAAILEAVERHAGTAPTTRPLRARLTDVAGYALDPRTLGRPDAGAGYPAFDPDRTLSWVWGWSFGRREPVLVPRGAAYFGPPAPGEEPPLAFETSNGCALGGSVEEAALHGLLEVAERDAFLLTWYARMPVPRVALGSARLRLLADRIERADGYRVLAFDTTLEHGIPSVLLLALDARPAPERPAAMCAAAAHLDPERACWAALGELALVVARQVRVYPGERDRAATLVADPDLVRVLDDHLLLYSHPATLPRWDFLDLGGTTAAAFTGRLEPTGDLRDDLLGLVARYRAAGLDVIVVDQTGPEQRAGGVSAVKVLVPGTLPMTFGHRNRRVSGLPRLRTVPALLGHSRAPLRDADLNPHPHPFS